MRRSLAVLLVLGLVGCAPVSWTSTDIELFIASSPSSISALVRERNFTSHAGLSQDSCRDARSEIARSR